MSDKELHFKGADLYDLAYNKGYDDGFADGSNQLEDKLLVEAIANYMVVVGCASTTTCNRWFYFTELAEHFHITVERLKELQNDIIDELYSKEQIMDEEGALIDEKEQAFDLMFFGNYCNVEVED